MKRKQQKKQNSLTGSFQQHPEQISLTTYPLLILPSFNCNNKKFEPFQALKIEIKRDLDSI